MTKVSFLLYHANLTNNNTRFTCRFDTAQPRPRALSCGTTLAWYSFYNVFVDHSQKRYSFFVPLPRFVGFCACLFWKDLVLKTFTSFYKVFDSFWCVPWCALAELLFFLSILAKSACMATSAWRHKPTHTSTHKGANNIWFCKNMSQCSGKLLCVTTPT
jgi:hypothetical protein